MGSTSEALSYSHAGTMAGSHLFGVVCRVQAWCVLGSGVRAAHRGGTGAAAAEQSVPAVPSIPVPAALNLWPQLSSGYLLRVSNVEAGLAAPGHV